MFWIWVCLGLVLINVGISMVVGILVGRFFGGWGWVFGVGGSGLKVVQRVDFVVVLGGRAWVISLPKIFVGKYFHFWKPPPLFCINSMSNVYYPIFFTENGFQFFI